ncbi:hypothetical protein ACFW81_24220 [Streptomyces angustmyceticus]|uniref:hypothetical protein n=1 Tax=Streptomyces angustmyceticus TaxID=285578 RepID=UPI003698B624
MYDRSVPGELNRMKRQIQQIAKGQRIAHGASLEDAALEVRDDTGSLRAIVGQQGDGTTAVNIVNGGPPPTPSTPTAGSALGGISAGWDGTFTDGAIIPLDWARVEVHASPDAGFTPSADTLKATIETAQGGIIYVPATAPQYVRLLARNTSGAASDPTVQVGPYAPKPISDEIGPGGITTTLIADDAVTTPKLFANAVTTPKLSAGSVDATALKADAITGKTITGGTITGTDITGATVTGGVLQTNTSGSRVVVTPSPPAGMVSRPTMLLYSGVTGELFPAGLNSGPAVGLPAQPTTALGSPVVSQDASGTYTQAVISLASSKAGSFPGRFAVATNAPTTTSEIGYAAIDASSGTSTSGTSYMNLYTKDGNTTGKHSSVYLTGDYVNINANGSDHTFTSSGLQVTGSVMAQNTPYLASKPVNTDRTSTTSRTADPHLTVNLLANATYIVEFHLFTGGSSFALTVTEWLVPSGATGLKGAMGPASSATEATATNNNGDGILMRSGAHNFGTTITYGRRNVNTNVCYAIETGTVTTTSAGTLALGWAQSTSSTTFNRMAVGSWMRVVRIA